MIGLLSPEHGHAILISDGEPAKQQRVGHGEHGGRETDTEGECEDGGQREAGSAAEAPEGNPHLYSFRNAIIGSTAPARRAGM